MGATPPRLRGTADELRTGDRAGAAHHALNPAAVPFPGHSIVDAFRLCVAKFGAETAVVHRDRVLDYRTLDRRSDHLAARLWVAGVRPGQIVGVCVSRDPGLIAGLLAVLKCGAAYLPFSEAWPDARLHELLDQAGCAVVLTDRAGPLAGRLPRVRTVAVPPAVAADAAGRSVDRPRVQVAADAVAYVNFTSGSQGRPKGVAVEHRSVLRLVAGAIYARLDGTRRVLQLAPVTFDAATFEIWGPLLTGGACVLYPSPAIRLSELGRVIVDERVTTVFLTTALFNSVVDEAPEVLDPVDEILTGGEAHSLRHLGRARARYGPGRLVHVYGPTESTTFATFHRIEALPPDGGPLPIGRPIQNTRAYVADGERLCAPGETGELLLAGPGLSPGYLGMPDATAARFVVRTVAGVAERLYRTGDLVHIDGDGNLVFDGRSDDQVKVNGFRIEPGEIAYHLDRHPDIRQSFVCVAERPAGRVLLAFVVPDSARCTADAVRRCLAASLPSYLVPAEIRVRPSLPLSPNGKVDRAALLARHPAVAEGSRP